MENVLAAGLVGTPEQVVEKLKAVQGLGMEYAITYFPEVATDFSGVELFQKEVVPACRKAAPQTCGTRPGVSGQRPVTPSSDSRIRSA